jgi:protein-disulfide isomerase
MGGLLSQTQPNLAPETLALSRKTIFLLLALLLLAGGAAAGAVYYYIYGPGAAEPAVAGGYTLVPTDRTLGNSKAKVVLIEYAAPTCPHCAHFNETVFGSLKTNFIDTGKVYYVFRVFPIGPDDGVAEKIARCLPEDKYFPFIDLLFRNQPLWDAEYSQENPALATPDGVHAGLVQLGRRAGMSADQVDKCIEDNAEDERINKVAADAQSRYSVNSTPSFILDGNMISPGRVPSYDELAQILNTELAQKK